jgi:hypothetical protein
MKKFLIVVLCVFFLLPLIVSAQVKEEGEAKEPATKLEAFLAKKGRLIVRDYYELGEVAGKYMNKTVFGAIVIYEPGKESQRIRGLTIGVIREEKLGLSSKVSFLDFEEIETLSKALEYMSSLSAKWQDIRKENTRVVFSTKGDFNIGFYQIGTEQVFFGDIEGVSCFFSSMQDLSSAKTLVDKGLKLLNEK